jgi:hypothetical protein
MAASALVVFAAAVTTAAAIPPPGQVVSKPGRGIPEDGAISVLAPENGEDDNSGHGSGSSLSAFEAAPGANGNTFVDDACLKPPPPSTPANRIGTVTSETEIAVLNNMKGSHGQLMIAGYNDSLGFSNNTQGLSGFSYSTNGGSDFVDGGGLPVKVPSGAPAGTPGSDAHFGDPVVVVHHATGRFFYNDIYMDSDGTFTLGVTRGRFEEAPQQVAVESKASIRCKGEQSAFGQADPLGPGKRLRPIWDTPVVAVRKEFLRPDDPATPDDESDFLDKNWIYVDQKTGTLYITYTRFTAAGETPIELVRCIACAFKEGPLTPADFTAPSVIVANEALDFNQATQPVTTNNGRVIVTWIARTFGGAGGAESQNRIEIASSDNDGVTWTPEQTVAVVNPQREPRGYNRQRRTILNAPYIVVDKARDDGVATAKESGRAGFNNVYIAYFSGKTPLPILETTRSEADVFVSRSTNNGTSFGAPVKLNDDAGTSTHIFPAIQVNEDGDVFAQWIDRRNDASANVMNDTWFDISTSQGASFGTDEVISSLSTSWFTRANARPNMGDYNSGELIDFDKFVAIWADGRFPGPVNATCARFSTQGPCPAGTPEPTATPDTVVEVVG